jgi:hypothetical protein
MFYLWVSLSKFLLYEIIIRRGNDLKSPDSIFPHINERYHSLHTIKPLLLIRILIYMNILNKRFPIRAFRLIPPRFPTDKGVKACDQRVSIPNFSKDIFYLRVCSNKPWCLCMAASIWCEKSDSTTSRPIIRNPCLGVKSINATTKRL